MRKGFYFADLKIDTAEVASITGVIALFSTVIPDGGMIAGMR